jgi:hypothetical protein
MLLGFGLKKCNSRFVGRQKAPSSEFLEWGAEITAWLACEVWRRGDLSVYVGNSGPSVA